MFLGRHKFIHFRVWYRELSPTMFVKCCSIPVRSPGLTSSGITLERMVQGHLKGDRNFTTAIHKILTLEHLHRLFFDSK